MNYLDLSLENFPLQTEKYWKFGLITRSVYRISDNNFEITDTSAGWQNAIVNFETMNELIAGKKSLLDLNWF